MLLPPMQAVHGAGAGTDGTHAEGRSRPATHPADGGTAPAVTRVTCVQLEPRMADLAHNREMVTDAIRDAVRAGADIVLLPELITSGYMFDSVEEARALAITSRDECFAEWAAVVGSGVVVGGFCEDGGEGRLFNSAAVVDRHGVVAVYRKTHLWDRELLFFTPGSQLPPVIETPHGRIGVCVCYDLEFPELTRSLALRGAELLAVPTAWPLVDCPPRERPPEVVIAMATARVNRIFIACCDRFGTERGQAWTAGTTILDEAGWVVASGTDRGFVSADLDLTRARRKSISERNDVLGDRRPELYGDLAADPLAIPPFPPPGA